MASSLWEVRAWVTLVKNCTKKISVATRWLCLVNMFNFLLKYFEGEGLLIKNRRAEKKLRVLTPVVVCFAEAGQLSALLLTIIGIFKFRPKTIRSFFFLTKRNVIQYANIDNFWLKKYKQEVWFNFDSLIIHLFCWIGRQKCLIVFRQILVILIVVARATEGLTHRFRPVLS